MVKYLGDTVASYEVDRINLVAMTLERDQVRADLESAIQILQSYIFGNNPHNDAVNFVQSYLNETSQFFPDENT